jgi:hypothetical protein
MNSRRLAATLAAALVVLPLAAAAPAARADAIYVINAGVQGAVGVASAISLLGALDHVVTTGGTLADYRAYDQVWDLRYQSNFALEDLTAFSSYLAAGGRVYFAGENPSFDTQRNVSLRGLLFALGAGDVVYDAAAASNAQTFTAEGAAMNTPNPLLSIAYLGARSIRSPGTGFLVTEGARGIGSMVAWDFGDIAAAPEARIVALWDIDVFRPTVPNGVRWVENIVDFLGADTPVAPPGGSVPEPATLWLLGVGLAGLAAARKKGPKGEVRTTLAASRRREACT